MTTPNPLAPESFRLEPSPRDDAPPSATGRPGRRVTAQFLGEMIRRFADQPGYTVDLLQPFAGVNTVDQGGRTMLHWAMVEHADRETLMRKLLEHGADRNQVDDDGDTPLSLAFQACLSRQTPTATLVGLLREGADPVFTPQVMKRRFGRSPLHEVVLETPGDEWHEVCNLLLARGVPVNAREIDGNTPLHLAADLLRPYAVQRLLAHGADVDAVNTEGNTPLALAVGVGKSPQALGRLTSSYDRDKRLNLVRDLLAAGADVTLGGTTRDSGRTPLLATVAGYARPDVDLFVELVRAGADPGEPMPTPPGRAPVDFLATPLALITKIVNDQPAAEAQPMRVALERAVLEREARLTQAGDRPLPSTGRSRL